jgi:O-antigen/teichoic acid export membrane protein
MKYIRNATWLKGTVLAWYSALRSDRFRKFAGILSANAFNNLVTFAVLLLAARTFGVEEFGRLSVAIVITTVGSTMLDFGLNVTLVRFYNTETLPERRAAFVRVILGFKAFLLLVLVPLGYVLQKATVSVLPVLAEHGGLVYLAFVSSGLLSFWVTMRAVEQARSNFVAYQRYTFAYGCLRIASVVAVYLTGTLSLVGVFVALYTAPLVGLLVYGWLTNYSSFWRASASTPGGYRESVFALLTKAFSYSVWVAISALSITALAPLPQFALAHAGEAREVGLYGAALTFVTAFTLASDALRTVVLPSVTALKTAPERERFRRGFLRGIPLYCCVGAFALGSMALLQYYVLGGDYAASVPIFVILGTTTIINIFLGIPNTLVHAHGIPRLQASMDLTRLGALALLLWLLPKTALTGSLVYSIVLLTGELYVYTVVKRKDVAAHEASVY